MGGSYLGGVVDCPGFEVAGDLPFGAFRVGGVWGGDCLEVAPRVQLVVRQHRPLLDPDFLLFQNRRNQLESSGDLVRHVCSVSLDFGGLPEIGPI